MSGGGSGFAARRSVQLVAVEAGVLWGPQTDAGGFRVETILGIDHDNRRVAYTITASPFPIEAHAASMQVSDAGGGKSTFQWITDITPDALAESFTGLMSGEISGLEERFGV